MAFDLNKVLENLKERGDALASFGKKDDDLIKVKDKEVVELSKDKKEDVRNGMNAGAEDYLLKPSNKEDLLKAVKRSIKKQ